MIANLDSYARGLLAEGQGQVEPPEEGPRLHVLAEQQNSASLCLYALLGLGLCKAAPCVKKWSWGGLPEWYHEGGPFQIGHSVAVAPDCLCPTLVCHFLPPPDLGMERASNYEWGLARLWPKSQYLPTVCAPRGPPFLPGRL